MGSSPGSDQRPVKHTERAARVTGYGQFEAVGGAPVTVSPSPDVRLCIGTRIGIRDAVIAGLGIAVLPEVVVVVVVALAPGR